MSLKIYNSLTRSKEEFVPVEEGKVTMYVCGPTVYSLSHIGHARSAVSFDVIYRYLRYKGYNVTYARNYTDVDDKIIQRANEEGTASEDVARKNIEAFNADMDALGILLPTHRPKATETIGEIIALTKTLLEKGYAYVLDGDVYYSVRLCKDYGKLSGKNIDDLESGARVGVDERKKDPLDFALWKSSKPGEPSWDSPWGKGRPGWHIECSAMCMKWLGETVDIHGGGKDLIFPHHENEIAQSESATGRPYVKYWLHNGFVNIEKEKMSKSLGNILNIRDVLKDHTSEAVRMFLLSAHYRSPIDYSEGSLKDAEAAMERYYKTMQRIEREWPEALSIDYCVDCNEERFKPVFDAMDDDFNTALVVGNIFKEVNRANRIMDESKAEGGRKGTLELSFITAFFRVAGKVLGTFGKRPEDYFRERNARSTVPTEEIERLIKERNDARKARDFKKADSIRDGLAARGIVLEDTAEGTVWSVKG
ncbi:MAG: cysteine--tRNA ligase [Deltaproteobacteria bacterium]|nr:cysteine--tRNA ligase [Deltaproteobacteria bacterium]